MRRCVEKIGRSGEGDGVPGEEEGVVGVTSVGGGSVDESKVRVVDAVSDDEDDEERRLDDAGRAEMEPRIIPGLCLREYPG